MDLILTRNRPDFDLKSAFSGPNQVEIGSKSGPGRGVGARGAGPAGRGPVAPPESLYTHLFLCILFSFFCPVRPSLPQAIFFPKILPFWDLGPTLSRREKATSRGWVLGTVLDEVAPQEKKGKSFFSGARKKVSLA